MDCTFTKSHASTADFKGTVDAQEQSGSSEAADGRNFETRQAHLLDTETTTPLSSLHSVAEQHPRPLEGGGVATVKEGAATVGKKNAAAEQSYTAEQDDTSSTATSPRRVPSISDEFLHQQVS